MQDLCPQCKKFDEMMNGGIASNDFFVECNHLNDFAGITEELLGKSTGFKPTKVKY